MSRVIGQAIETLAQNYLKKHGYKIVATNVQYSFGELDIVARDKEVLVFVEVKYRASNSHGAPFEAVAKTKQQKIIKAAQAYLQTVKATPFCRFDVISMVGDVSDPHIEHLIDAFWTE